MTQPIDAWRRATAQLGLTLETVHPPRWTASCDGVPLTFGLTPAPDGQMTVHVAATLGNVWPRLVILDASAAFVATEAIQTGDPTFDKAVAIADPDGPEALGVFDLDARHEVRVFLRDHVAHVASGAIHLTVHGAAEWTDDRVTTTLRALVAFARRFELSRTDARAQAQALAGSDPDPRVRAELVRRIVREVPLPEPVLLARLHALIHDIAGMLSEFGKRNDGDLEFAHRTFGPVLVKEVNAVPAGLLESLIAGIAAHGSARDGSVLALLAVHADPAIVKAAVTALMDLGLPPGGAFGAFGLIGPIGREAAARALPAVLTARPDLTSDLVTDTLHAGGPMLGNLRAELIAALAATGNPHWIPLFTRELANFNPMIVIAALDALAEIADHASIPAIRPFTEGFLRAGRIKSAARRAIEAIETRHGEYDGAMSLADAGGAVTLADPDHDELDPAHDTRTTLLDR